MLYHLDFHVEYPDNMTQQELFTVWSEEVNAALQAKQAGVVVDWCQVTKFSWIYLS